MTHLSLRHWLIPEQSKCWVKKTFLLPFLGFGAIYAVTLITTIVSPLPQPPILACSMGASAVILLTTPSSPFASPWSFVGGHLISALIGISCAIAIDDPVLAAACAVGGAMMSMQLLRCMNPPGAATALAPVVAPATPDLLCHYLFLLPLLINIFVMLLFSMAINRFNRSL